MSLKNSIKYYLAIFNQCISKQKFILILIFSIVAGGLGAISGMEITYFESFLMSINDSYYIMFLLLLLFINTKITIDVFKENYFYIIRLNSKKEYINKLIKTTIINNLIIILLNFIILIIWRNLFGFNGATYSVKNYTFHYSIYLIYCIIKLILITSAVSSLNILLLLKIKYRYVLIFNCLLCILPTVISNYYYNINSIIKIPLSPTSQIMSLGTYYNSFISEILFFIIYFVIFLIIIDILKKICLKYLGDL